MHFKRRNRLYLILIVVAVCLIGFLLWGGRRWWHHDLSAQWQGWKDSGNAFLYAGRPDSAIAQYDKIIACADEAVTDQERCQIAKAYNNKGYVYFYCYRDYVHAYDNYLRSLRIAEQIGYGMAVAYLNIANVYSDYGSEDNATKLYRKAFYQGLKEKDWPNFMIIAGNLFSDGVERGQAFRQELSLFFRQKVPSDTPLIKYTRLVAEGYQAYLQKEYPLALEKFRQASLHVDTRNTPERSAYVARMMMVRILCKQRQYDEALRLCQESIETLRKYGADDSRLSVYVAMSSVYAQKGDKMQADACRQAQMQRVLYHQAMERLQALSKPKKEQAGTPHAVSHPSSLDTVDEEAIYNKVKEVMDQYG